MAKTFLPHFLGWRGHFNQHFGGDRAVWRDGDWGCENCGWWMLNERKCCGDWRHG